MTDRLDIDYINRTLGAIETPMMNGDNISVMLCSHFDNQDQDEDSETHWTPDAIAGCDEVLAAIKAHYAPLILALQSQSVKLRAAEEALCVIDEENQRAMRELTNVRFNLIREACRSSLKQIRGE